MDNISLEDLIIEFIKNPELHRSHPEYSDVDICSLIEMTGNFYFAVSCLENESLLLSTQERKNLILAIAKRDFVRKHIKEYDEYYYSSEDDLRYVSDIKRLIIATSDVEYIKQCITDDSLFIDEDGKISLIKATGDVEYIKQCIKDDSFGFDSKEKCRLVKATGDVEYIKQCIKDDSFDFDSADKRILVEATGDVEYIKQCIKDDSFDFDSDDKRILIEATGDVEYIKQCVQDDSLDFGSEEKFKLLKATRDNEYIKQCIQDDTLNLSRTEKFKLIEFTGDIELVKKTLKDLGDSLTFYEKERLLCSTRDFEYMKQCMRDDSTGFSWKEKAFFITRSHNIDFIKDCISDSSIGIPSFYKADIIVSSDSTDFIKSCLLDPAYNFNDTQKANAIAKITMLEDNDVLKEFLTNKVLQIGIEAKMRLIASRNDVSFIDECIADTELGLRPSDKMSILQYCSGWFLQEYIKENSDELSNYKKGRLLLSTDSDFIKECLETGVFKVAEKYKSKLLNSDDARMVLHEYLTERNVEEPLRNTSKNKIIGDASELSLEDLKERPEIQTVRVGVTESYTRNEYMRIRRSIDEIIDGVEPAMTDDEEVEVFKEIYTRLAYKISYDKYATLNYGREDQVLSRNCRNLYNGLIKDECVCSGYSEILRNVLACVGIEAKTCSGLSEDGSGGHAWNQVKIGGKWFNVDLTNDRNRIIEKEDIDIRDFLKTDTDFENVRIFSEHTMVRDDKQLRLNIPIGQNRIEPKCGILTRRGIRSGYEPDFYKYDAKELSDFLEDHEEPICKDGFAKCYTDAHEFFIEKKTLSDRVKTLGVAVKSFASKFKFGLPDLNSYYRDMCINELRENRSSRAKTSSAKSHYDEMDEI